MNWCLSIIELKNAQWNIEICFSYSQQDFPEEQTIERQAVISSMAQLYWILMVPLHILDQLAFGLYQVSSISKQQNNKNSVREMDP